MKLSAKQKEILDQLPNYLPEFRKDQISPRDGGNIALGSALDAKAASPDDIAAISSSNLVGVDGTGNNAAPLAGTETRLDAIEAKLNALIAALKA